MAEVISTPVSKHVNDNLEHDKFHSISVNDKRFRAFYAFSIFSFKLFKFINFIKGKYIEK